MLIFVSGLPRVGKTSFGRRLAKSLEFSFIDLDEEIVKNYAMVEEKSLSCKEIYQNKGSEFFRQLEEESLDSVTLTQEKCVISLGGGSLLSEKNRTLVKERGYTLFLTVPILVLRKRLSSNTPAYMEHSFEEEFNKLTEERSALIQTSADLQVDLSIGLEESIEWTIQKLNLVKESCFKENYGKQ